MPSNFFNESNLYKLFFEHSTTHKWVRSIDGKYLTVNQAYADSLLLKKEDIIGKTNLEFMPKELAENFAKEDELVIKRKIPSVRKITNFLRGKDRTFLVLKFPLFDKDKNVCAVAGAATDMTNEKLLGQNLKQKENLLSSVIHNMGDGLLFFNYNKKLKIINREAKKILASLGIPKDVKDPQNYLQFFPLKENKNKAIPLSKSLFWKQTLEGDSIQEQEFEISTLENRKSIQISLTALPVKNHKDEILGVVVVFKDITERNILIKKIHKKSNELKIKNEALEEFAYFITHDLREPFRTINSFLSLLQDELKEHTSSTINTYIKFIKEAAIKSDKMIEGLNKFCLFNDKISLTQVNLEHCLKKALDSLNTYLNETKTKIHYVSLPTVRGNETSLTLLFQNLIMNAAKFQNNDVTPEIFVTLEKEMEYYIVGVKDNGIGIDPRDINKIFLPFKRLSSQNLYKGSGLGLALCKKIIEAHNSEIWVESTKGKGAHFKFKLKEETCLAS